MANVATGCILYALRQPPESNSLDDLAKARAESTPETERSDDCRRFLRLGGALKKLGPSSRSRLLRELGLR
jgi:hypothetical protein